MIVVDEIVSVDGWAARANGDIDFFVEREGLVSDRRIEAVRLPGGRLRISQTAFLGVPGRAVDDSGRRYARYRREGGVRWQTRFARSGVRLVATTTRSHG